MSQLVFDLELEPATETAFDTTLKGRYGLCHGAGIPGVGWFAWCDDCSEAKRAA